MEDKQDIILTCIGLVLQNQVEIMKNMDRMGFTGKIMKTMEVNDCIRKIVEPERRE